MNGPSYNWNGQMLEKDFEDHDYAMEFALKNGFIHEWYPCPVDGCQERMKLTETKSAKSFGAFRCQHGHPRKQVSRATGTWFSGSKLKADLIFRLVYCFSRSLKYKNTRTELRIQSHLKETSQETIVDWSNYLRDLIQEDMERRWNEMGPFGGPGHYIQMDESLFGHIKGHIGHPVHGHWVFGIVDVDTKELRMIPCPDNFRNIETLGPIIRQYVADGSWIWTDSFKTYEFFFTAQECAQHKWSHAMVNHKENYVAPITGVNTQIMEAYWRPAKDFFRERKVPPHFFEKHLFEHLWRHSCDVRKVDYFEDLLNIIRRKYPVNML